MTRLTIGVDPGVSGAIVILDDARRCVLAWAADEKPADDRCGGYALGDRPDVRLIVDELRSVVGNAIVRGVVIESPFALAGGGVTSALTIGTNYGHLRAALVLCGWPVDDVTPAKWSAAVLGRRPSGGWEKGAKKAAAIEVCRTQIPTLPLVLPRCKKAHDGLADAGCLALWGMSK